MRKTLVILFAVAILGGAGVYAKEHHDNSSRFTLVPHNSSSSTGTSAASTNSGPTSYKDGTFTGDVADTPYGSVQIAVVISGGKITDVNFLQMPNDFGRSIQITQNAEPQLKQTTFDAQSSQIDFVSGATSTSYGYQESLQAALDKAKTA